MSQQEREKGDRRQGRLRVGLCWGGGEGEPGAAADAVRVIVVFNRVKASERVGCMGDLDW